MELEDLIEVYLTRVSKSSNLFLGSGTRFITLSAATNKKQIPTENTAWYPSQEATNPPKKGPSAPASWAAAFEKAMRLGLSFNDPNSKTIALDELSNPDIDDFTSEKKANEVAKDTEKKIDWCRQYPKYDGT